MPWSNWSKRRKAILLIAAAVLLALIAIIYPEYRSFVDEDNAETCYDARYWTGVRYLQAVRAALEEGTAEEDLDYEELLRGAVEAYFTYELDEDLISDDLCRGGGTCTFVIDEESHSLSIECDHAGHEAFDDSVLTEEFLDYVTW